jgi:hypothetical protein
MQSHEESINPLVFVPTLQYSKIPLLHLYNSLPLTFRPKFFNNCRQLGYKTLWGSWPSAPEVTNHADL